MIYVISCFIIILILSSSFFNISSFNFLLILILFLSLSELFKHVFKFFTKLLNEVSLEHNIKVRNELEKKRLELLNWHNSLKEAEDHTLKLRLKSLYVILRWAIQSRDQKSFDSVIAQMKILNIPDECIQDPKKFEQYINDVDNGKYVIAVNDEDKTYKFVKKD